MDADTSTHVTECFNGASLFRARKQGGDDGVPQSCGVLQWGLTLSSEETQPTADTAATERALQWGLTLSSEETTAVLHTETTWMMLQWGLTLSSEET